jgi:hypothetical protein
MNTTTLHDEIESWLAADIHGQLSEPERDALHQHLVECKNCRQLHQEEKIMHKLLEENLASEKADPTFEQRMLSGFRRRVPDNRGGFARFLVNALRARVTQVAAAAVVLLALVQTGRVITHEELRSPDLGVALSERTLQSSDEADRKDVARDSLEDAARAKTNTEAGVTSGTATSRLNALAKNAPEQGAPEFASAAPSAEAQPEFREEQPGAPAKSKSDNNEVATSTVEAYAVAGEDKETNPSSPTDQRKLIRNANVELEIVSFDDAVQKITAFAKEERGYVATSNSEKQANGKLRGEVVVKVLPDNLDRFLQKIRGLGELKNQTLGSEDVTKAYFDTDSRLKNARVMEQRLIDMMKTKTGKVSDLLQVEKELGRVREEIEKMQGELKYWDSQVQFATVTISLTEKDMEEPAAFLLKERAQLSLYSPDVEKIYNDVKALASPKVQIVNAQLNRDNSGRVSANVSMLIAPDESDSIIARVKGLGRVENFQVQSERVAQGGEGMSENAKTKRDKVQLNITFSRDEQEQSLQQTTLRIRTAKVDEKTKQLRDLAAKQNGRIRTSSFSSDPEGREFANVSLRVPMKNYAALMQSLDSLGNVENVSVQRQDRTGEQIDEADAPADVSIQVYSQGNIVSSDTGIIATIRRTLGQAAAALMWSVRMIGVALAFFAPWLLALAGLIWGVRKIVRIRKGKREM